MRIKLDDNLVLNRLKELQKAGQLSVRAGEIARYFSVDSVRALGAMLRVKHQLKCNLQRS